MLNRICNSWSRSLEVLYNMNLTFLLVHCLYNGNYGLEYACKFLLLASFRMKLTCACGQCVPMCICARQTDRQTDRQS